MEITKKDVLKISNLACIKLSEEEIDLYLNELNAIIGWVEELKFVNTLDIDPMYNVLTSVPELYPNLAIKSNSIDNEELYRQFWYSLPMRKDIAVNEDLREKALSNAPLAKYNHFVVPKFI